MRYVLITLALVVVVLISVQAQSAAVPISESSADCIDCHSSIHPGIVKDWQQSRHAKITPKEAIVVEGLARKVSAKSVPENLLNTAVGCAECHMLRPKAHADTFEHNAYDIHVVVSPDDCRTCHPDEAEQYSKNINRGAL